MDPRHRFIQCHNRQGRVAVLVEFGLEKAQTADSVEFTELSRSIVMHIAVLNPQSTAGLLRCGFHACRPVIPADAGPAFHAMPGRVLAGR
jgi:hypothetical protein